MILNYKITLTELSEAGKNFKWDQCFCKKCQRPMWGHGFVGRYFYNFSEILFLKRYRCPDCAVVVTTRPCGYWPWIRSSIFRIYQGLIFRISNCHWPESLTRQCGGHWLKRFIYFTKMSMQTNLQAFLSECFLKKLNFLSKIK